MAERETINPLDHPDELFAYYSIPAYQQGDKPALTLGREILSLKLVVEERSVLFGKLNPRVPKVWLVSHKSERRKIASTEFIPLLPKPGLAVSDFLFYLCWSGNVMPKAQELVSGSTPSRQRVDTSSFLEIRVPIPPLPEQQAIAAVLRTVHGAKEACERVLATTRQLKQSLLHHLLTYGPVPLADAAHVPLKETKIGPLPEHWDIAKLGDFAQLAQYGLSLRGNPSGRYPILRMNNLQDGKIVIANIQGGLQYVELDDKTVLKFRLAAGDLLFNRTNSFELVGKTSLFELPGDFVFASYIVRLQLDSNRLDPRFANYCLNMPATQARLKFLASRGVSQSNINATKLKGFEVPLPPLPEQQEIAAQLSAVDAKLAAEESRRAALVALFQSLLHHLMTGRVRLPEFLNAKVPRREAAKETAT